MNLGFPDQIADGLIGKHQLESGNLAAVSGGDQLLGNHRLKDHGQLYPDLLLGVCRENIDDPVDGIGRSRGVKGGNDQMAGLRRRHGDADGLIVSHFP